MNRVSATDLWWPLDAPGEIPTYVAQTKTTTPCHGYRELANLFAMGSTRGVN